jgi:hypothetical protein
MELKSESTIETDVDLKTYFISKITITRSNQLLIGFQRKDYTLYDEFVLFKDKFPVSGLGIDDYIFYTGEVNTNLFERLGISCSKSNRNILDKRIVFENSNILLFNFFADTLQTDSKKNILLPGYEIITLSKSELEITNKTEIKSTPFQTSMCAPRDNNIIKNRDYLYFNIGGMRFSKIKKLPNGNWLLASDFAYRNILNGDINFNCFIVASVNEKKSENTWIRILPNTKRGADYLLGLENNCLIYKNDIYFVTNEHPSNIESLKYNCDKIINNGHLMGDSIPDKNSYNKIGNFIAISDVILRIDKISETGNVTHNFVKNIPNDYRYFPVPDNSWITDEGILYVQGLIDYEYDWNLYQSCNFMMIDLNAIK